MSLKRLQELSHVAPDGKFGPNTFKAASAYLHLADLCAVHFFAQCAHESGHFSVFEENLNYNENGLLTVFRKYFPDKASTVGYVRNPEKIANKVYANRMGNGSESSGDGWKYRGRGAIQMTGKNNYTHFFNSIGQPNLINTPEVVSDRYSFDSAAFFFTENSLWTICANGIDDNVVRVLTKRINGGYNGIDERIALTRKYFGYISK
jgi:putative chitinase